MAAVLMARINYASSPLLEYAYPPINETIVKNITNGSALSTAGNPKPLPPFLNYIRKCCIL